MNYLDSRETLEGCLVQVFDHVARQVELPDTLGHQGPWHFGQLVVAQVKGSDTANIIGNITGDIITTVNKHVITEVEDLNIVEANPRS